MSYLVLGLILFGSIFIGNGLTSLVENKNFKEALPFYLTCFLNGSLLAPYRIYSYSVI